MMIRDDINYIMSNINVFKMTCIDTKCLTHHLNKEEDDDDEISTTNDRHDPNMLPLPSHQGKV